MAKANEFDVIVAGGGTAGLCAALAAAEQGAGVLVLEAAPPDARGGNTSFADGVFRFPARDKSEIAALVPDEDLAEIEIQSYSEADMLDDLMRISNDRASATLLRLLVRNAYPTVSWLKEAGVRWGLAIGGWSFVVDGVRRFWSRGLVCEVNGGGAGLIDQLTEVVRSRGVELRYEHRAVELLTAPDGGVGGLLVDTPGGRQSFRSRAVVLASGGFEANAELRARYLGPSWDLVKVRGSRYNVGDGAAMALAAGAEPFGNWSSCHAVAWDLGSPEYGRPDEPNTFARHSYPFGIVVNREAERFVDEGADFRSYTYARYGREILKQPGAIAFQIFDSRTRELLREQYRSPDATLAETDTIEELADELLLDPAKLVATVAAYNESCGAGKFDPSVLDGKRADGPGPPKSNWATPISEPPFLGYPVTTAITFTFAGLRVDNDAAVLAVGGRPIQGLFAAGELIGGLFYENVPGGSALISAATLGRIAGAGAAGQAKAA